MPIELGYGSSQYASHGRPVCSTGNNPAHITANKVIASANRLIELPQLCLSSARMAEISVPAWPMPIHQTKLMMATPVPLGTVMPQSPARFQNNSVLDT